MNKEQYFENRHNYISEEDKTWCGDYCKKHWPEDVEHILRIAEDTVNNRFLFDLRWDMERTYEPVVFDGKIVWDYMPGDDPEFIFQFNRHQFFICLGQAYAMTGDEKYAEIFASLLQSWVEENPLTEETKKTTWRSIEAGIRVENWVKAMAYFKSSPWVDDAVIDAFGSSLIVHAEYLMTTYKAFQIKSNWGVIENKGLMEIALALPRTERTETYLKTALERLEEEARIQILDDGVHWEQSTTYHNEVLHCYLEVLRLAQQYDVELPCDMKETIRHMGYADLIWKKPNHCQVMQGDSDESDVRDMLSQSAYLLNDPVLKSGGYSHMDYDGTWEFLKTGILQYEALTAQKPDFLYKVLKTSGNLYVRSGWEEDSDYFHFRCGFLGGGHGHSDKLHIDLTIHGEDILMDTGRYQYVAGPHRTWFKSALGHNVPLVDGRDYLRCKDAWGVGNRSAAYGGSACQKDGYTFVQGGHAGYLNAGMGNVWVNRKVIGIGTDLYVIADEFFTTECHKYQQMFHFNNQGQVTADGDRVHYKSKNVEADMVVVSQNCRLELTDGALSRNYNQMETGKQLLVEREKKGFCSIITVIAGGAAGAGKPIAVESLPVTVPAGHITMTEEDAEAIKITWKGREYVILVAHRDIADGCDLMEAGGVKGLGSVIVFDVETQKIGGTVLHW